MKLKGKIVCIYFLLTIFLQALKLDDLDGLKNLDNYNEIKNIEVERVVDYDNYNRNGKYVYVNGENTPFTGVAVRRENSGIVGLFFIING